MVFSNLIFLYLFLPLCLAAYFLCRSIPAKNAVLIVFSLIFYAWGEPVYLFLMIAAAAVNWGFGLLIEKRHKRVFLVLALVLCLSLAACGAAGGGSDDDVTEAPEAFEGLVKDTAQLTANYAMYRGVWLGDGGTLVVEESADGDEMRFVLYDAGENIAASGFIQLVQEYSADYFYNEHDGLAHHSWLDGSGTLQIDSLGAFTKASGDVPGENIGDTGDEALVGEWYQDGEAGAVSILVIYQTGIWDLYERPGGDGDPVMVDRGTLEGGSGGLYQAPSVVYDGVVYDMTVVSGDTLYWGGENDCYQKLT